MSEREEVLAAIRQSGGNISKAARALGHSRRTLQNRMRQLGIPRGRAGRPRHKLRRRSRAALGLGAAALVAGGILVGRRFLRTES